MNTRSASKKAGLAVVKPLFAMLLLAPLPLMAADDAGIAELRALVMSLQAEVNALKERLADDDSGNREAAAPVANPARDPEHHSLDRQAVSSEYGIDIYGFLKLDAFHDSALTSHQIPFWVMPDTEFTDGTFDMTMKETRIGMDFGGPEYRNGRLTARLEMDFYGNVSRPGNYGADHAYQPRTRHAYLNWAFENWSVLAGKTWEPYIVSIPDTLNFAYYNFQGQLGFRKTQVRFTRNFELGDGGRLSWVSALLDPWGGFCGADLDGDGQDDATDSDMPVFSSKLSYQRPPRGARQAEFAFSAVYGQESFDVHDREFELWAVQAGFVLQLADGLTWKLSMYRGANLDSLWGSIAQGIHELSEIDGRGGWTQLQLEPPGNFRFNLGYSVDNPDDDDLGPLMRSRNETWLLNGYYSVGRSLLLGLEYLNVETSYKGGATAPDHRIQSSLIYRF